MKGILGEREFGNRISDDNPLGFDFDRRHVVQLSVISYHQSLYPKPRSHGPEFGTGVSKEPVH